jgi:hypothetical protein
MGCQRYSSVIQGWMLSRRRTASRPLTCRVVPNTTTCSTPGFPRNWSATACRFFPRHLPRGQSGACAPPRPRCPGQQVAVGDVGQFRAALRLIHVMRGDEHGQPLGRQLVNLLPKIAPRLRVHPGGRLVQQQQLRLVNQTRRQRQPLLPAAGKRAGQLPAAGGHRQALQTPLHGGLAIGHFIQPGDEIQILLNGQVLVKTEPLRHVARVLFDLGRLLQNIVAQTSARCRRPA